MKTLFTQSVVRLSLVCFLFCASIALHAQWPGAITIEPPDATAYDELTLIFDPEEACFMSGSLAGLPSIAMHSGVTFQGGSNWQHVIAYNATGYNGQSPILLPTGDGRYSITYIPAEFYGLMGQSVTQICAVFNNGIGWNQDGRDFIPDSSACFDFFIPLNLQMDVEIHFMANMNLMIKQGNFMPAIDSVFAYLNQPSYTRLYDEDGDGIYANTYEEGLISGQTFISRFRINENHYEDVAREITVFEGMNYVTGWWNDEPDPDTSYTIADFENGTTGPLTLHVMGCGEFDNGLLHPVEETFFTAENPSPDEVNPSASVMKFFRRGLWCGSLPWGGFWANIDPELDVTFLKYIHVKVLKPRITPVRFKLEAGTSGTLEVVSDNDQIYTDIWEEMVFDFSQLTGTYPIVAFMPDYESPLTIWDDIEIYFDDIVLSTTPYPIYVKIDEPVTDNIDIYPNPADNLLVVRNEEPIIRLSISDMAGRVVLVKENLLPGESRLELNHLSSGLYLVSMTDERGNQYCEKMVKRG